MSLPGKLCVGILEEDNPLRSYFRFKPLLIDEDGRYVPYEGFGNYPEEGCIRIVPDKNESYHFKSRMRRIGPFCVVDLREHPGESDKIRPNKNYRPGGEEINASIIYSDVVRAPAEDMVFEILPGDTQTCPAGEAHTETVLLREGEGISPRRHTWEAMADSEDTLRLTATEDACDLEAMQIFELSGFRGATIAFAIRPAGGLSVVSDAPAKPAEAPAPAPEPAPQEAPKPQPVEPVKETPSEDPEKPWIHHDESMLPPPVDTRLSRAEQLMAAQAGLNPRRGRSLQELIEEKWQRSRLNQLGQPAGNISTGAPVQSPVEAAVAAVRDAWSQPQMRRPLMDALDEVGDFTHLLNVRRESNRQSAAEAQLNALEAQRLELMDEVDKLKAGGQAVREQLKQEIRRDEAQALADAVQKTEAARSEQARCEQLAREARDAAKDAQGVLDALAGDQLEQKIRDVALTRRVVERLELLKGAADAVPPACEPIALDALMQRVTNRFAAEGWKLSPMEAANLCACLAAGPVLMLSGAPGSGKTAAARLLGEAAGLADIHRAAICPPGEGSLSKDPRIEALKRFEAAPAIVVLDDANLSPASDLFRGLAQALHPEWRLIATLQDAHSGLPVTAAALDRGFMVRLSPPADLPWNPGTPDIVPAEAPVSLSELSKGLPDLPTALIERMDALRKALDGCGAAVSRRALNEAWRYCAAMLAMLGKEADILSIFDLAVAQRLLPGLLAAAPVKALRQLPALVKGLPACEALFRQPLPISI